MREGVSSEVRQHGVASPLPGALLLHRRAAAGLGVAMPRAEVAVLVRGAGALPVLPRPLVTCRGHGSSGDRANSKSHSLVWIPDLGCVTGKGTSIFFVFYFGDSRTERWAVLINTPSDAELLGKVTGLSIFLLHFGWSALFVTMTTLLSPFWVVLCDGSLLKWHESHHVGYHSVTSRVS